MPRGCLLPALLLSLLLGGCAWMPKMPDLKFWGDDFDFPKRQLELRELRRALLCGTPTEEPVVRLFDSAQELKAWDADNTLQLDRIELPDDRSFVLIEQGLRRTSGYSIEVAKTAQVNKQGTLSFEAEWLEPGPDRMVAQMLTSLCVLTAVEAMPYERVEVRDRAGELRAVKQLERD